MLCDRVEIILNRFVSRAELKAAASSACEVNAGEREGDEDINDEESDDTINTALIPYFFDSACRSLRSSA